jgi:hypothetical protein
MQHEWSGVSPQFGNNEGDTLGHQARDKGYIAGRLIEFCNNDAAFRNLGGSQGCCKLGRLSSASAPLPVSNSTNSALIASVSLAANCRIAAR